MSAASEYVRRVAKRRFGRLRFWENRETTHGSVKFRTEKPLSLKDLTSLSEELGTEKLNFDFGESGERGYSDRTPGEPAVPGFVEVFVDEVKVPSEFIVAYAQRKESTKDDDEE